MPPIENQTSTENNSSLIIQPSSVTALPTHRGHAFLLTLTFLLILTGIFAVWDFSHPVTDEDSGNTITVDQFADWKTYTNSQYGFEFKYPTFGTEVFIENKTNFNFVEFIYTNKTDNTARSAFGIEVKKIVDGDSYEKWLKNDDNFRVLNSSSNGGIIYFFDPPTPQTHSEDGPVANAYIISPDKKYVFELSNGQDTGIYSVQRYESQILSSFKFISTSTPVTSTSNSSGIFGTVTIGPTCPVERIPPDPQCAPRPFAAGFEVKNQNGQIVGSFVSDSEGKFSVKIPAGSYTIVNVPAPGTYPRFNSQSVTVLPNKYTEINLQFDSGIR